jgi:hypothetical protein
MTTIYFQGFGLPCSWDYCGSFMARNDDGNGIHTLDIESDWEVLEGVRCDPEEFQRLMEKRT